MKKVNEVSRLAGVSKRTLQFYDDEGLLPAQRSKDNYRLYDDAALERLWEILVYRAMGLDLKEIKDLLTLSEKQKNQYLEKKIRGLRQQIRQLNGQMEFISYVQQNGMLPVPTEENTVEKTYMDHIAVLRKMKQDKKREDKEKKISSRVFAVITPALIWHIMRVCRIFKIWMTLRICLAARSIR